VIASAFADLGFDVDIGPLFATPRKPRGRRSRTTCIFSACRRWPPAHLTAGAGTEGRAEETGPRRHHDRHRRRGAAAGLRRAVQGRRRRRSSRRAPCAVLAVDPSSTRTGGSILGDKTRMSRLAVDPNAFIRPSPSSGTLGGVAAKTRETMLLCEAAGYDVLIVETVGVGQSETTVADMTDFFLVLMVAGAGDELQGLKKGIVELADMIAVNKSDGDNIGRARVAAGDYRAALHILAPRSLNWSPPVITYSALTGDGNSGLWNQVMAHKEKMTGSGELAERRRDQQVKWMWTMLEERLTARLRGDSTVRAKLRQAEAAVAAGKLAPTLAVEEIAQLLGV
jgi:LAO/AO transport system kinase